MRSRVLVVALSMTLVLSVALSEGAAKASFAKAFTGQQVSAAQARQDTSQQPNVIILFADDLGYGDLSSYGHPVISTPHLDRLADEGTRFKAFYTAPWCVPSRTQLLTGRYMSRMDFQGGTGAGGEGRLPPSERTLAEVLSATGYSTHMLGKWHLGYKKEAYLPVGRGFDTWYGLPYSNDYRKPWVQTDEPLAMYEGTAEEGIEIAEHPINQDQLTTGYTERAVRRIKEESRTDEPFFLYLAYNMPHLPIYTAERFRGASGGGLYADVIETIDWSVGQILQVLDERGIAEKTIVFFASDNGPWLNLPGRMRAGGNKPWHQGTTGPLRGAKHTTWEGGVRVPAVIRWPGHVEAGVETGELAAMQDLYISLIEAAGGALPDYELDGYDLMPWLTGREAHSPRERYYYVHSGLVKAMREGPWKLHLVGEEPAGREGMQLFNLASDPAERWSRAEANSERVRRMLRQMQRYAERIGAEMPN